MLHSLKCGNLSMGSSHRTKHLSEKHSYLSIIIQQHYQFRVKKKGAFRSDFGTRSQWFNVRPQISMTTIKNIYLKVTLPCFSTLHSNVLNNIQIFFECMLSKHNALESSCTKYWEDASPISKFDVARQILTSEVKLDF